MAGKSKKSEKKLSAGRNMKAEKKDFRNTVPALPKDLREKMDSEKNPEAVMVKALENYYGGQTRRYEIALQKEIDNNIIEIQRRHISDLKEQLEASNRNYEELMKTYQAYMLQVQPMVEAAQLRKAPDLTLQSENERQAAESVKQAAESVKRASEDAKQTPEYVKQTSDDAKQTPDDLKQTSDEVKPAQEAVKQIPEDVEQVSEDVKQVPGDVKPETKSKKWYEFWK